MDAEHLKLTDFMDLPALQEIQDHFAAVANVRATITDADGTVLTQAQPAAAFVRRQRDIAAAAAAADAGAAVGYAREGAEYVAPIMVNDQRLGTLRMSVKGGTPWLDDATADALAGQFGLDAKPLRQLATQLAKARDGRPAAIAVPAPAGQRRRPAVLPGVPAPPADRGADGRHPPEHDPGRGPGPVRRPGPDRPGRVPS